MKDVGRGTKLKKKEKKEFKSFGELAEYIWDYYKWGIIAGVFVLICVISFVREKKNKLY